MAAFAARLQANFLDAGISGTERGGDALLLHHFVENLKPEYGKRLRIWGPSTFNAAFESSLNYEKEASASRKEKLLVLHDDHQTKPKQSPDIVTHMAKMQESISELCSVMRKEKNTTPRYDYAPRPRRMERAGARDWSASKCFHCKTPGHPYFKCPTASIAEKEHITANLDTYIAQIREQKYTIQDLNSHRPSTKSSQST